MKAKLIQPEARCVEQIMFVFNVFPFPAQILNWNDTESIDLKKKEKEVKGFALFKKCVYRAGRAVGNQFPAND